MGPLLIVPLVLERADSPPYDLLFGRPLPVLLLKRILQVPYVGPV